MGGWNEILREVNETPSQPDRVRRKYLKELSNHTKRNVITYYSGWLSRGNIINTDINDSDLEGFMNCIYEMNCSKGLDLILHTPGGFPDAAESIVTYLRDKFNNDIRVIVPHLAMSAGTMIACSSKVIIMGKESSLGPTDPQFNGISAYNILDEFEEAKKDLVENPKNAQFWAIRLQQYPAAFAKKAIDAISLSEELLKDWLGSCMFDSEKDKDKIDNIESELNEHKNSKTHGRHRNAAFCKEIGLNIEMLEDDSKLQDIVLSLHHSYMITFDQIPAVKIIENSNEKSFISIVNARKE